MVASKLKKIRRNLSKQITVLIIPHLSPAGVRKFKFTLSFLIAIGSIWTLTTLWAGYIVGRNLDYHKTKAENRLLTTKLAFISQKINRSKKYLVMTHQADEKLRQLLKMKKENITKSVGIGGATFDESMTFRKVLAKKAAEISERVFASNIDYITQESKKTLSSFQDITWYITNEQNVYKATPSIWPTSGRIASSYGYRVIRLNGRNSGEFHYGLDIANKPNTPIYATADGVVRLTGWAKGYGQAVLIDHGFGFSTIYGHTTQIKVKPEQYVKRGQLIALMGTTGRSSGTHLHYEIWKYGEPVNPTRYLKVGTLTRKDKDLRSKISKLF